MIIGTGSDIVHITRIQDLLTRFGPRFEQRIFTGQEIHRARNRPHPARTYAKRFAAKEAFAKALGSGLRGVSWTEVEVISGTHGQPQLTLHGNALTALQDITPSRHRAVAHLSLSDEHAYALAFVVLEAVAIT